MKFALIGAVAVVAATYVTPALAQAVIDDPGYCANFYPNVIAKTWDRAIRIPVAATIAATRRTATRSGNAMFDITMRRAADMGGEAVSRRFQPLRSEWK